MSDNFYKRIIEQSPTGYAYHKIICDKTGTPCDYVFIEVNKAFEELTGMKGTEIVGKTISRVQPGIKNSDFDWIACYGEVALYGEKKEFEQYSEHLHKWFRVNAYSPEEGFFVTLFSDITNERNQINAFHKLSVMYEEFLRSIGNEDYYQKTTENFLEISDAKFATFNLYDEDGKQYTTMAIAGDRGIINRAMSIVGHKLERKKWIHDPVRADKIKNKIVTRFSTLHYLAGDVIPKPVCDLLTNSFGLGETVLIKITKNNIMIGDFTLIMPKGKYFDKDNIVEIFARQLGLMITQRRIDEKLRKSESRHKAMIAGISDVIGIMGTNEIIKYTSPNIEKWFGWLPEDLVGTNGWKTVHPDDLEWLQKEFFNHLNEDNATVTVQYRYKCKDSTYKWIELVATNLVKNDAINGILLNYHDITERMQAESALKEKSVRLSLATRAGGVGVWDYDIVNNNLLWDDQMYKLYGVEKSDFNNIYQSWKNGIHPDDIERSDLEAQKAIKGEKEFDTEFRVCWPDGTIRNIKALAIIERNELGKPLHLIGTNWDITEHKQMEQQLFNEKEQFKTTLLSVGDGVISADTQGNVLIMNKISEQLTGWSQEEAFGKPMEDVFYIINEYTRERCENPVSKVLETGSVIEFTNHTILISKNGIETPIEDRAAPIKDAQGNAVGVVLVFRDYTEKKQKQEQIEFLSYNDQLTGLYNRRYYEQEIVRLDDERYYPLTLIMADVNGLKLTNDAFGHKVGDLLLKTISSILKNECRENDIVARIGGDEFVLLLPKTDAKNAEIIVNRINEAIKKEKIDNIVLSISMGYAVKQERSENIDEVFMKAEDDMYRNKLCESNSMRSKTIDLIMNTLFEKNSREKLHSERVGEICKAIAEKISFTKEDAEEIKLAGLMHDIGKIGIAETVLNKPDELNTNEWDEVKRHSETGYRILSSTNEFSKIASYVLEHHEKWDGTGYPKGLKQNEISLQARIIAVADAYDAMTKERTYRKVLSEDEAIAEITKFSGTHFDPDVVKAFVEKVLGRDCKIIF